MAQEHLLQTKFSMTSEFDSQPVFFVQATLTRDLLYHKDTDHLWRIFHHILKAIFGENHGKSTLLILLDSLLGKIGRSDADACICPPPASASRGLWIS